MPDPATIHPMPGPSETLAALEQHLAERLLVTPAPLARSGAKSAGPTQTAPW